MATIILESNSAGEIHTDAPVLDTPPPEIAAIFREWQHCNYEFAFAPHRFGQSLDKILMDMQKITHYLPASADDELEKYNAFARTIHGEEYTAAMVLDKAMTSAMQTSKYYKMALNSIHAVGITLDTELEFCQRYVSSRILERGQFERLHHFTSIAEDLYSPDKPQLLPTFLIQPWYSLLLRGATNSNEMVIEHHFEQHPTLSDAILCTLNTDNIPLQFPSDPPNPRQRSTWQVLEDREQQCSLLGLKYSAKAEGDILLAHNENLPPAEGKRARAVSIVLTLPLLTPEQCRRFRLVVSDIAPSRGNDSELLGKIYGMSFEKSE